MRLRHLDADRAAADDQEMVGPHAVRKNRLVGQMRDPIEAGDRRDRGVRASRDHKAPRPHLDRAGADGSWPGKPRLGAQYRHTQPLESFDKIIGGDIPDDFGNVIRDSGEIDPRRVVGDAERPTATPEIGRLRRRQQRL